MDKERFKQQLIGACVTFGSIIDQTLAIVRHYKLVVPLDDAIVSLIYEYDADKDEGTFYMNRNEIIISFDPQGVTTLYESVDMFIHGLILHYGQNSDNAL